MFGQLQRGFSFYILELNPEGFMLDVFDCRLIESDF